MNILMIYHGSPQQDVLPYVEGTEPVPFAFDVQDADPPAILTGFNFSDDYLEAGQVVVFVRDMFQRLVYSKRTAGAIIQHSLPDRVEEPAVSSPYRDYLPNFTRTDKQGDWLYWQTAMENPFHLHHLSSGLFRLNGKNYAPIQATYFGGEFFVNDFGLRDFRRRGELRFDRENRPLYLLGRHVKHDPRFFALHQDFLFVRNTISRDAYHAHLRSDSPFLLEYVDGRECNFDIKPIPVTGVFPEEWELTTDFTQAQKNYDIFVVPAAADGECFVKGEILCFIRKVSFSKVPVYLTNGIQQEEKQWAAYTYYEAVPYPSYWEPLRGQGVTDGYYFKQRPDYVESVEIEDIDDPEVIEYARLELVPGTGVPALHREDRVCRLCDYAPSRGVFYKMDSDHLRYPIMVSPDASEGYGISVAVSQAVHDSVTNECHRMVHHPSQHILRQGTELMLTAATDCWQPCEQIQGTVPPAFGDPRRLPKQIIFISNESDVTGEPPDPVVVE